MGLPVDPSGAALCGIDGAQHPRYPRLHPCLRYVRLLHHPIAAVFSRCLTDFYSPAHGRIDRVPEVAGCAFGDLHSRFPGACLLASPSLRPGGGAKHGSLPA